MTRLTGRIAGGLYFLSVLAAVSAEFVVPGALGVWAVVVPVAANLAATALLCSILKPVSSLLALGAVIVQIVALTFETLQWQPAGINVGMAFHGLFCLVIGMLVWRSDFLPRLLGALSMFAGFVWLLYLSSSLANMLAPANTALGLLAESALMLWLLLAGVKTADPPPRAAQVGDRAIGNTP